MTSSYENIYSKFLGIIKDYHDLPKLSQSEAYELLKDWLDSIISKPKLRKLFASLTIDDEILEITYTLRRSVDEEWDKLYVEKLLAYGMVIGWLEPKYQSSVNVMQFFGGKEQKMFSQSNHMDSVGEMLNKAYETVDKDYIRDHAYSAFILSEGMS